MTGADEPRAGEVALPELPDHPIGTLFIVALYGVSVALGRAALDLGFLSGGAPRP